MGIRGIPIPYRAPNANAHIERFHRTLRREALDHFIFLSEDHIRRVCLELVELYNRARPSQATGRIPEPYPELEVPPVEEAAKVMALPVLGGLQHDYRIGGGDTVVLAGARHAVQAARTLLERATEPS